MVDPKSDNLVDSDGVDTIKVQVDSGTSLTLSGTYMFTRNWAFDILAAYPFSHDIKLNVNGESAKAGGNGSLAADVFGSISLHARRQIPALCRSRL